MRLKVFDIYIIKKFLGTFFYAIALLSVVIIIFDISEKIDDFIENEAPIGKIIFQYYVVFIPGFINMFSYLFTFIAVIFFTSKLAMNTEIVAILSSGVSFNRFLYPYMLSAFILTIMSFMLANFVIPGANVVMRDFKDQYIEKLTKNKDLNIHLQISPGTFVYVESFNSSTNTGQKFSLEKFNEARELTYKMNADRIVYDSITGKWQATNYYIRTIADNAESLRRGAVMDTVINLVPKDLFIKKEEFEEMNYLQIRDYINEQQMKGNPRIVDYQVEKHKRIAFPFATLVMTLIGVSLSSRKVRGGIGLHLGSGIALAFLFILIMQISSVFATSGDLAPWLAAWLPNILFGIVAIYLYYKRTR
ncbi:MAG: YjgP/YjgQ family permease [Clostridia bacterium]|nr:YjgP/YjgQ family permease [Clostridia bacterium]